MAGGTWAELGSLVAILAIVQRYMPFGLHGYFMKYTHKLVRRFYPYITISISEFSGERLKRSDAYAWIQAYLSTTMSDRAMNLKAEMSKDSNSLDISMAVHEEVTDDFKGAKLWWACKIISKTQSYSFYPVNEGRRYYMLTFHKRHRRSVVDYYLPHVMEKGKEIMVSKRQRRLYTNVTSQNPYDFTRRPWSHVVFEHPASFGHIAMDPENKREIIEDLDMFRNNKDYYAKIGKPWKRGYLLYGPPGTGKSTMISAMANYLNYDVYDLELTAVKDNTELRKLLIETTGKSIIVIEDIDCSLDLTAERKKKKKESNPEDGKPKPPMDTGNSKEENKVTLSGLLNFIDGLWSACGGERIIIFTTNHVDRLDPALIRTGRMDKHIEMSYCTFEGFKVLARNYLDLHSHRLFDIIPGLMEEAKMSPADVAERLIPKTMPADNEKCLEKLIEALKQVTAAEAVKEAGLDSGLIMAAE